MELSVIEGAKREDIAGSYIAYSSDQDAHASLSYTVLACTLLSLPAVVAHDNIAFQHTPQFWGLMQAPVIRLQRQQQSCLMHFSAVVCERALSDVAELCPAGCAQALPQRC